MGQNGSKFVSTSLWKLPATEYNNQHYKKLKNKAIALIDTVYEGDIS